MTTEDKQPSQAPAADHDEEATQPSGEFFPEPPTARRPSADPTPPPRPSGISAGDPLIGKVLDHRYRVLQLLAKGGMGRVYRAEQAPLNRIVALKVLDIGAEADQDAEFRDRFTREAGACARLTHPNTIRIFDYGCTWDDVHYIAMEYLEGRNLHSVIRSDAPMPAQRVVAIATQVCNSLNEAHEKGLIHRDLKPSNVMLLGHGEEPEFVKVLDFGLVKELKSESELTRTDAVVGSPSYMSPEQIRAERVDQRSDIYALGVLLCACLTGRTPFSGANSVNVLMAHLSTPPPRLRDLNPRADVGPVLEWIVATCLAKAAEDRFATVDELRRALSLAAAEAAGQAVPVPPLLDGRMVFVEGAPTPSLTRRPPPRLPPPSVDDSLDSFEHSGLRASPSAISSRVNAPPVFAEPAARRRDVGSPFPWAIALIVVSCIAFALLLMIVWVATHGPLGWTAPPTQVVTIPAAPATTSAPPATDTTTGAPEPPAVREPEMPPVGDVSPAQPTPPRSAPRPSAAAPQAGRGDAGSASPTAAAPATASPTSASPASAAPAAAPPPAEPPAKSTAPAKEEPASLPSDLRNPWKAP